MNSIIEIIKTMSTSSANVNPTEIYNEGWMTRLLVYYSVKEQLVFNDIDFNNKHWTSEALLSSPFVGGEVKKREGYTHADIILGDFEVKWGERGQVVVKDKAKFFGVLEAKMGSPLSKRTSNAPKYNQASRNITCIAYNTNDACKTFFYVLAPKVKIKTLEKHVTMEVVISQIKDRFKLHNSCNDKIGDEEQIMEKAAICKIGLITYEDWINEFKEKDCHSYLNDFYENCKTFNKIK